MQTQSSLYTLDHVCSHRQVYQITWRNEEGQDPSIHFRRCLRALLSPLTPARRSQVLNFSRTVQSPVGMLPWKSLRPGFNYWCCHVLDVWPWTSCVTSSSPNFLISEAVCWIPPWGMDRVLEGTSVWCCLNPSKAFVGKLAWKHRTFFREPRVVGCS